MYSQLTDANLDATISGLTVADVYKQSEACFAAQNPILFTGDPSYTMPDCDVSNPQTKVVFYTGDATSVDPADIFRPPSKRTCSWSIPILSSNQWPDDGYTFAQDACKAWFNKWFIVADMYDSNYGPDDYCELVTGGGDVGDFSVYGAQLVSSFSFDLFVSLPAV